MIKLVIYLFEKCANNDINIDNIKTINNQVWNKIHEWNERFDRLGRSDCVFNFSHQQMNKRIIYLFYNNDDFIGYASIRQNEKGVSSWHNVYFPSINLYVENIVLQKESYLKMVLQKIYDDLKQPFMFETEYYDMMKVLLNDCECLPIVPFYSDGTGFAVYPKIYFKDIKFELSDSDLMDDVDDNVDDAIDGDADKRMDAMHEICNKIYPGVDDIIQWVI